VQRQRCRLLHDKYAYDKVKYQGNMQEKVLEDLKLKIRSEIE